MVLLRKTALAFLFLLVAGLVRIPIERPLGREMRATGLLAEPLDQKTSEAIGQTSAAIALGGLRSLVASVLNFSEVVPAWQKQDWLSIFNTYEQIHTLQPKVAYYWESAASYAADDAYADYRDRIGVPDSQKNLRRDELFAKGVSYLDEGIANIPNDLGIREMKARFYSDTHKPEHLNYTTATEVLDEAIKLKSATAVMGRQRLYLMSRVPARRREALALVREFYAQPEMRFPSIKSLLFTLQKQFPDDQAIPDQEIFRTNGDIIRSLFNHYQRGEEGLPITGIRKTLEGYLKPMELPYTLNPLLNKDIKRVTLKISDLLDEAPFNFPEDPNSEAGDWPLVVNHFEYYQEQSLPTMRVLFFVLQNQAEVKTAERVPIGHIFPNKLVAVRDLANFKLDSSHNFPNKGVSELIEELCREIQIPNHLSPIKNPNLFPLTNDWMDEVRKWQIEEIDNPRR